MDKVRGFMSALCELFTACVSVSFVNAVFSVKESRQNTKGNRLLQSSGLLGRRA